MILITVHQKLTIFRETSFSYSWISWDRMISKWCSKSSPIWSLHSKHKRAAHEQWHSAGQNTNWESNFCWVIIWKHYLEWNIQEGMNVQRSTGNCPGMNYVVMGGNVWGELCRECSGELCLGKMSWSHAGLQFSMCSGYDLCHPGSHTHRHTER